LPKFYFKGITDGIDSIKNDLRFRLDKPTAYNVYVKYKNTVEFCKYVTRTLDSNLLNI